MTEISIFPFVQAPPSHSLLKDFMNLRHRIFVKDLGWSLHDVDGIEFDQYDTPVTIYVIAHKGRQVLGGARLLRCDCSFGAGRVKYSYMIRDAVRGLLDGMPRDLCHGTPPDSPNVWELTRLAALPGTNAAASVLYACNSYLLAENATHCLFLGSPAFLRMSRSMGFASVAVGPVVQNRDARFQAIRAPVTDFGRFHANLPMSVTRLKPAPVLPAQALSQPKTL